MGVVNVQKDASSNAAVKEEAEEEEKRMIDTRSAGDEVEFESSNRRQVHTASQSRARRWWVGG
jgi:hypothetical protein